MWILVTPVYWRGPTAQRAREDLFLTEDGKVPERDLSDRPDLEEFESGLIYGRDSAKTQIVGLDGEPLLQKKRKSPQFGIFWTDRVKFCL